MSIQNRRAKFDYEIKETYVAGIVLESNEVKPLRSGKASIQSSFINEKKGEIYINNFEIISRNKNFDLKKKTRSVKKLLLNKREIKKAVEELFKVEVLKVTTSIVKGKRKRNRFGMYKRSDYKKAIILKPNAPEFYNNLAGIYYKIGKNEKAIENYLKSIEEIKLNEKIDKPRILKLVDSGTSLNNKSVILNKLQEYEAKSPEAKELEYRPQRDLELETLAGVLKGEILVQNHCYRAEEMAMMIDIANEFNYKITAFHHAVEAYKIADLLADNNICAVLWADWWGFKHEAYDMTIANIAIVDQARGGTGCAIVHSDSASGIQRLNQEAAKALAAGRRAGFEISEARAMTWLTKNPAKSLGILDKTGTLDLGKDADLVIWDGNPFSVYTKAEQVYIDGALTFDKASNFMPHTDFDIGIKEWEEKFDLEQKKKEEELIKKFYSDNSSYKKEPEEKND